MTHVPEGIIVVSAPDLIVTAISELGSRQLGRPRSAIEGQPLANLLGRYRFLTPNGRAVAMDDLPVVRSCREGKTISGEQWVMEDDSGRSTTVLVDSAPVYDKKGSIIGAVSSWADIAAIKQIENDLRQALDDEEFFRTEANHRFRNHLQMMSSFLSIESTREDGEGQGAARLAKSVGQRLSAISSATSAFHHSRGGHATPGSALVESVCRVMDADDRPIVWFSDPDISLGDEQVTPLALAINEALTNALKHAFPDQRHGSITVSLRRAQKMLELEVADDGVGLSESRRTGSMGMGIMEKLANQLSGKISVSNRPSGGCIVRLEFPERASD